MYLYGTNSFDIEKFKKGYIRHYNTAKNYFENRAEDFLIINIIEGEGWEKLCPFLKKKIPNKEFPHLNITKNKNY